MLDADEVEIELVGVAVRTAELAAVVGEHRLDLQLAPPIEGQHVVVQDGHRSLGPHETYRKPSAVFPL
jgi:hypothetical protein